MKNVAIFAAVASLTLATPALANNFTGVRAEATVGLDDVTGPKPINRNDVKYGFGAGVDAEIYKNVIVGVEGNVDNVFDRRNIGVGARLGYVVTPNVMVYGKVGYANWKQTTSRELEGLRFGGGVEAKVSGPFYVKAEFRHTHFDHRVGTNGGLLGVGVRF